MENDFYMLKEIKEILDITKLYKKRVEEFRDLFQRIQTFNPSSFILISRGTSDNAAVYGKYLIESALKVPTSFASFSLYIWYNSFPKLDKVVGIAISQSGETEDVLKVVEVFNKNGAFTIGVTNEESSSLYKISQFPFLLKASKEHSVAATKTYTSTLLFFLGLTTALTNQSVFEDLVRKIENLLNREDEIKSVVKRYRFARDFIILGRGFNYPTALEFALKLRETCLLNAVGFSPIDFLHGPIASLDKEMPVIFFIPKDETFNSNIQVLERLKESEADVLIVSDEPHLREYYPVFLVDASNATKYPILFAIFLQLFSFYLSIEKGYNPDKPKNLKKVTYGI